MNYILTIWVQIRDIYLYFFRHAIIVNGYVDDHTWKGIRHRNWGDDLNYYMIRELTGRPVIFYHNFKLAKWLHLKNYMCIGTLLDADDYANSETFVWGSGSSVDIQSRPFGHPQKIFAVRGILSKMFCQKHNINCPDSFGDPALLLPIIYQSHCKKTHQIGIIPHYFDLHHPIIKEIREKYADEVLVIDLANYKRWTDVIDQICSCEKILSSSLHGLIVSDAYQIPNCWIRLTDNISGGRLFKYHDYASSVGRIMSMPAKVKNFKEIYTFIYNHASYKTIKDLQNSLIDCCPFPIKIRCKL